VRRKSLLLRWGKLNTTRLHVNPSKKTKVGAPEPVHTEHSLGVVRAYASGTTYHSKILRNEKGRGGETRHQMRRPSRGQGHSLVERRSQEVGHDAQEKRARKQQYRKRRTDDPHNWGREQKRVTTNPRHGLKLPPWRSTKTRRIRMATATEVCSSRWLARTFIRPLKNLLQTIRGHPTKNVEIPVYTLPRKGETLRCFGHEVSDSRKTQVAAWSIKTKEEKG